MTPTLENCQKCLAAAREETRDAEDASNRVEREFNLLRSAETILKQCLREVLSLGSALEFVAEVHRELENEGVAPWQKKPAELSVKTNRGED